MIESSRRLQTKLRLNYVQTSNKLRIKENKQEKIKGKINMDLYRKEEMKLFELVILKLFFFSSLCSKRIMLTVEDRLLKEKL